jgi:hypothetical protein
VVYSFPDKAITPPMHNAMPSMINLRTCGIKNINSKNGDIVNKSIMIKGSDKTNVIMNRYLINL